MDGGSLRRYHRPSRVVSNETPTPLATTETQQSSQSRYLLLVDLEKSSTSKIDLPLMGDMVLGRSSEASVRLSDPLVSRQHAQLAVSAGKVEISDLGSRIGTRVNGELLKSSRVLYPGDAIELSANTTLIYRGPTTPQIAHSILDPLTWRERLSDELARCERFLRNASVMDIEFPPELELVLRGKIAAHLRVVDLVCFEGPHCLVLLPETSPALAHEMAGKILAALVDEGSGSRAGTASFPADAANAIALLASARLAVESAEQGRALAAGNLEPTLQVGDTSIVVADPAMKRIYALIRKLAASDVSVLIEGETGTGKELVAWALHHWSSRGNGPFVALNCGAIPESLIESELFGFEKGAFSGAAAAKAGLIESAHGGTIFFDEVGELSKSVQVKLLRVLESRRVTRIGATRDRDIDVRIVAATHRRLEQEVEAGNFRQDLFFRLNTAQLNLPPLRERSAEIPILCREFMARACRSRSTPLALSPRAMQVLLRHRWPGNIRELKNAMDYLAATVTDEIAEIWQLPDSIAEPVGKRDQQIFRPIEIELRDVERQRMAEALAVSGGNQTRAAELISMPLRTFVFKLKKYEMTPPGSKQKKKSNPVG